MSLCRFVSISIIVAKFIYGGHTDAKFVYPRRVISAAKYHYARSPRIHQVQQRLCTTTGDAEHLRIVYNYFRYGRVQLLPLRPVNDYFP